MKTAPLRNASGWPVSSAPPMVPATQHPASHKPARHRCARKNAANTKTHRYHAPCIHADRPKPAHVAATFHQGGLRSSFDHEKSSAIRMASDNK